MIRLNLSLFYLSPVTNTTADHLLKSWRRPAKAGHALVPRFAGGLVGFQAGGHRALGRYSDRGPIKSRGGDSALHSSGFASRQELSLS